MEFFKQASEYVRNFWDDLNSNQKVYLVIITDNSIPFLYNHLIHMISIIEWAVTELYNVLVTKMWV